MGFSVDKHLKMDKLFGTVYSSTEPHPIKVAATAPSDNTRADEIAIETAKAGKVTAVVAVMSMFCIKRCNCVFRGQEAFMPKGGKCQCLRGKFLQIENLSLKT